MMLGFYRLPTRELGLQEGPARASAREVTAVIRSFRERDRWRSLVKTETPDDASPALLKR